MPAVGGGGRGNSGRRKVVRKAKPKPRPAASFVPGVGAVAKPSRPARAPKPTPKQVQRATRGARPLAARPVKPKVVVVAKPAKPSGRKAANLVPVVGEAKRGATKPLQAKPPRNIKAGKPVRTAKQRRSVAVAAYDELDHREKKAVVNAAHNRAVKGKATEADKAVLHAHRTRVAGTKKVARAVRSFDALTEPKRGLHLDPRVTLATEPKPFRKHAGSVATLPSVRNIVKGTAPFAAAGYRKAGLTIAANAVEDVAELATTSPSSVAKFAVDAVKHPKQAAKEIVKPYKELAKDPVKFAKERPVTTVLMVQPAPRAATRGAGKALRLTGKQTLERPAAKLPHTALKEERIGSRDVVRRAVQKRQDRKQPEPTITANQIDRRVDEAYAASQKHTQRVRGRLMSDFERDIKTRPRQERPVLREQAGEEVGKVIVAHKNRRVAQEFGANPRVVEHGTPVRTLRKTGERVITRTSRPLPSREEFIAQRPKPARDHPDPNIADLSRNLPRKGKPGIAVETPRMEFIDPKTKAVVELGNEIQGLKAVVARDREGRIIGSLRMTLDAEGKPDILEVAVDPAHRGKGIASQLYAAAEHAGLDVEAASGRGGLTEAGAALKHKRLSAKPVADASLQVRTYEPQTVVRKKRVVVEQPGAPAHLHDSAEDARHVAEHLNAKNQTIPRGSGGVSDPAGRLYAKEKVPVKYVVRDAGFGKHAVVPEQVNKRLNLHGKIGTEKAVPAVMLRQTRRMFSKAVLPYHPTWLSGQAIEGTARTAVAGAGPTSWMRAKRLEARHPDVYKALAERAVPGGIMGRTVAHEMAERTLAQELPESNVARMFTELGRKPGIKQVRQFNDAVTNVIFERLNGRLLEGVPQKVLLGRALKRHPLMDRKVLGLSNKAIDELAAGVNNPATITSAAREVQRTYGRFAAFSPRMRSLIMHWTPFLPWYLNMGRFLVKNLPQEHPVAAGLVADISAAEEEWRKEQGLSLRYRDENSLPPWMLGGLPVNSGGGLAGMVTGPKGENIVRIGHYVPAASSTPSEDIASLVLPQFLGAFNALYSGRDWKQKELKHSDGAKYNEGERVLYAAAQLIEALVPGAAQAAYATSAPEMIGGPAESNEESLGERATKLVRPVSVVKHRKPDDQKKPKRRVRRKKPAGVGAFGGGSTSSGGYAGF